MRIKRLALLIITASALAFPAVATAQTTEGTAGKPDQPAAKPADPPAESKTSAIKGGAVDFGVLGSSVVGDDSRYNRFRDLGNGPFIDGFRTKVEKGGWYLDFAGDHIARKDARYGSTFVLPGTFKGSFQWDQIRELVSDNTKSLFTQVTPGVLRVDDNVQSALAAATAAKTISTVLPATLTNFDLPVTLGTERHTASGKLQYFADKNTDIALALDHSDRTGAILYSGTFGFSNAVDIPQPINQHTTNANLSIEHKLGADVLLRAGFTGSYFRNDSSVITWDNPYQLTDSATLSSQGRTSVTPSNNFSVFNGSISAKLPGRSRFTAYTAFGFLDDNGQMMIPETVNTMIAVVPESRNYVGGKGQTRNANLSFVSRPNHIVSFDIRYRYYDYVNQTPVFTNGTEVSGSFTQAGLPVSSVIVGQRVAYDSSLQNSTTTTPLASMSTERFGGSKQTANIDMHINVPGGGSLGVGYDRNAAAYDDRIYSGSGENNEHVTYDALSTKYFSLHTRYDHAIRRGERNDEVFGDFLASGEQAGLIHYDIADRNRDLFTLAGSFYPISALAITVSAGDGRDSYPSSNFGLTSAKHTVYGLTVDVAANDHMNLSLGFNQDHLDSLQFSRNASSPPPAAVFSDPSKDWSDNMNDRTLNVLGSFNLVSLFHDKVDLRFGYDYTRGRGSYLYATTSAPLDAAVASTLPTPVQLPQLSNDFTRGTADFFYRFTPKFGIGLTYWYEQFKVSDLALDSGAIPNLNIATTDILMGYQYLPYKAQSFFARVGYRW